MASVRLAPFALACVCVVVIVGVTSAFSLSKQIESDIRSALSTKSLQICGARLGTAIAIVCKGRYNTLFPKPTPVFPSRSKRFLNRLAETYVRRRRGIVDECCKAACSMEQIEKYCLKEEDE